MNLSDLTAEIREINTKNGWREDEPARTGYMFNAYLMLICSEVAEAQEAYRDKVWTGTCPGKSASGAEWHVKGCSGKPHDHPKPIGVGPELADTIVRVLDTADLWGIDIEYELRRGLAYNRTRPYQHGGRTL